jgi:ABC-type thiamine transport system ATPase subunit
MDTLRYVSRCEPAWQDPSISAEVITTLELSKVVIDDGHGRPSVGLTVRIDAGEIVTVSGRPGFGGTTLARVIAGHLAPRSGKVMVDGRDIALETPADRRVGFVPVDGGLLPQLTLEENIVYGSRFGNEVEQIQRRLLKDVVEKLDLKPSLGLRPHEVSPGQRVRAALARAKLRRKPPYVLVIDATAGSRGVTGLARSLERVWGDPPDIAVLFMTGDAEVADQTRRLVWLEYGVCTLDSELTPVRAAPPSLAVAQVVVTGPVAVVSAVVRDGQADLGGGLKLPLGLRDGRRVKVLLRTESLEVVPQPVEEPVARVLTSTWRDNAAQMLVEPLARPGQRWPARSPQIRHARPQDSVEPLTRPGQGRPARSPQMWHPRPQDRVGLRLHPDRVLVFDADNELPVRSTQ